MSHIFDLGVDLESFDGAKALTLLQARELMFGRGRGGHPALDVVGIWARPHLGCRPRGRDGPVLVLPTIMMGRMRYTMPAWVEAFEKARRRLGVPERPLPAEMPRPIQRRRKAQERAEAALRAAGI